jgi:hypothetical protein
MNQKKALSFAKSLLLLTAVSCAATPGYSLTKAEFEHFSTVTPTQATTTAAGLGTVAEWTTALAAFNAVHANYLANMPASGTITAATNVADYLSYIKTAFWNASVRNANNGGANSQVVKVTGATNSTVVNVVLADVLSRLSLQVLTS